MCNLVITFLLKYTWRHSVIRKVYFKHGKSLVKVCKSHIFLYIMHPTCTDCRKLSYYLMCSDTAVTKKSARFARLYLFLQKMSNVLHVENVQRRHRFVWICKNLFRFSTLLCTQSYLCSFLSCLDRNELLRHINKVDCDMLITSGMTVRSFNDSVLTQHIESFAFYELNNEAEGKVTSMD